MEKVDPIEAIILLLQSYRVPHVSMDFGGRRLWMIDGGKSPAPVTAGPGGTRKRRGRKPKLATSVLPVPAPEPDEEFEPLDKK